MIQRLRVKFPLGAHKTEICHFLFESSQMSNAPRRSFGTVSLTLAETTINLDETPPCRTLSRRRAMTTMKMVVVVVVAVIAAVPSTAGMLVMLAAVSQG
jgi:hypothetical protein